MTDKTKLTALAALAGGWENLARALWAHTPKREKERATKRLNPKAAPSEADKFAASFQSYSTPKRGRPEKYDPVGLGAIYAVLEEMERLGIGASRIDRIKKIVCYANDPRGQRITGLTPSYRDLLKEPDVKAAVPEINLEALLLGRKKATDAIDTYAKYLSTQAPRYKKFSSKYDDLTAHAKYDYEGD